MFKPELWQSHDEYRTLVSVFGRRLSRNNPKYAFNEYDEEHQKLLNLNLEPTSGIHHRFLFWERTTCKTSDADSALTDTFYHAFQ